METGGIRMMNILVEIYIGSEWNDAGVNCAKVSLRDSDIKRIFQLSKKAGKFQTIQEYDCSPELGTTEIDCLGEVGSHYLDMASLKGDPENGIFTHKDSRIDCVQLHVDRTSFWWEGCFKHTDVRWSTRIIPLTFLPKGKKRAKATTAKPAPMTTEQMNAIHEKIARGYSHGLNASEIEKTFQRHVTKAQLIRCIIELIERSH
jgi:hypothetical protein